MTDSNYWKRMAGRPMTRRLVLRGTLLGGAGLAAAALVGCSSGQGKKPENAPAAGGAATQPGQPAAGAPKTGGRLTSTFSTVPSFDVHRELTAGVPHVTMPAFNQLLRFDPAIEVQTYKTVIADLAEKWEIAPDGQTYTFHLVKNAKFHDGTPFTSADVKASYERQLNPPAGVVMPRGTQLLAVKSFETPDPYTLTLKMSRPVSPLSLLPILAQSWMCMYSQKDIAGNFDFKTKINGTGPFRLKSVDMTTKISYDKNKDYHVKDRPYLDGIDYYNIPDASTLAAQVQSGAIHVAGIGSPSQFATLKQALGDKAQYQHPNLQTVKALNMNSQRMPFKDERVRRAVALAYNKLDAIKVLEQDDGYVGGYMYPGGAWALSSAELEKVPGYQPYSEAGLAEANKLVAAAGIQSGTPFTLLASAGRDNWNLFLKDQVAKIGLKANLNIIDYAKQYDDLNSRNFDAFIIALAFFVDDPDAVYPDHFLTNSPLNYSGLGSKAVDDLFLKQSVELDPLKRAALVKDLDQLAMPQLSKLILYYSRNSIVIQKAKNFIWSNHQSCNARMDNVWLDV